MGHPGYLLNGVDSVEKECIMAFTSEECELMKDFDEMNRITKAYTRKEIVSLDHFNAVNQLIEVTKEGVLQWGIPKGM